MLLLRCTLSLSLILTTIITACGTSHPSVPLASPDSHACYSVSEFKLCVPHPGKGRDIIAKTNLDQTQLAAALLKWTGYAATQPPKLVESIGGETTYVVTQMFPSFIAETFNTQTNFSGPNCYNTALLASGGLERSEVRYVSLAEFDQILAMQYTSIDEKEARFGDVLVYDAKFSREHAALYLGDGLIFQKKAIQKGYGYRIAKIDAAYDPEPGEWEPSPFKLLLTPPDTAAIMAPRAFYRRNSVPTALPVGPITSIINRFNAGVLKSAPYWSIHKDLGMIIESISSTLRREFRNLKDSKISTDRLAIARLESLSDQIFLSIDETLYSTPFGATRNVSLKEQFCYDESSQFLAGLAADVTALYRPEAAITSAEWQAVLAKMKTYDRSKCDMPFVNIIKDTTKTL